MPEELPAGLTEASRANDVRPYSAPFQNGQIDSSAPWKVTLFKETEPPYTVGANMVRPQSYSI